MGRADIVQELWGVFFVQIEHPDSGGVVQGWTKVKGHGAFCGCSFSPLCPSLLLPPLFLPLQTPVNTNIPPLVRFEQVQG